MGFSTIGSFVMMFFGILIMISSLFIIYTTTLENTNALSEQQDTHAKRLATSISIINVTLDVLESPDKTTINVINDGKRMLDKNDFDVYIGGEIIPRDNTRIIGFLSSNNVNPMHWDPDEIIQINVSKNLDSGNHEVVVATEFGITDSAILVN